LSDKEVELLYEPFMRGENAKNTIGIGLGLRMVHRILHFYGFAIQYSSKNSTNMFALGFKHI
jgi:K+-sensing histidine kinase KdpD